MTTAAQQAKAIVGGVAGLIVGNGATAVAPESIMGIPWWGVIISQVVYFLIGYLPVYLTPNAPKT